MDMVMVMVTDTDMVTIMNPMNNSIRTLSRVSQHWLPETLRHQTHSVQAPLKLITGTELRELRLN